MWIRSLASTPSSSLSFTSFSFLLLLLLLGPLCTGACPGEELPREVVLDWFRLRVLEGLGLEEAPVPTAPVSAPDAQGPPDRGGAGAGAGRGHRRSSRVGRAAWAERHRTLHQQDHTQIILFPSTDSTCSRADLPPEDAASSTTRHFTYYFQPSLDNQELMVTAAHLWFYAGEAAAAAAGGHDNSSSSSSSSYTAPLFILTSDQKLLRAAEGPSKTDAEGWTTYRLEQHLHAAMSEGPFALQVRCPACDCGGAAKADKTPFVHLLAQPRAPDRARRHAATAATVPWSLYAVDQLRRPAPETRHGDCHREEISISFEDLGWENWIVHPKSLNFSYCHGNCSAWERTTARLGIQQCCTPVPGTMKSLRVTTTDDGGFSLKYETLPNIIPEECICM